MLHFFSVHFCISLIPLSVAFYQSVSSASASHRRLSSEWRQAGIVGRLRLLPTEPRSLSSSDSEWQFNHRILIKSSCAKFLEFLIKPRLAVNATTLKGHWLKITSLPLKSD
eukprot:g6571.t1